MSGFIRVLTGIGLTSVFATAALAGPLPDVGVTVVDRTTGQPLAGASVCLGTSADQNQFGAHLTDANGTVVFNEIPRTELILTVSKPQYMGYTRDDVASESNRILAVSLHTGGLGPVCEGAVALAPEAEVEEAFSFAVRSFRINKGDKETADRSVELSAKVAGQATHYRASEHADFHGAAWRSFDAPREFELSRGAGDKTVYFQVRRHMEIDGAVLQSLSNVSTGSILLVGSN